MGVGVNETRHDEPVFSINHNGIGRGHEVIANRCNAAILNQNIAIYRTTSVLRAHGQNGGISDDRLIYDRHDRSSHNY